MVGWHHRLNDMSLHKLREIVNDMLQSMGLQRIGHDLATEQQKIYIYIIFT